MVILLITTPFRLYYQNTHSISSKRKTHLQYIQAIYLPVSLLHMRKTQLASVLHISKKERGNVINADKGKKGDTSIHPPTPTTWETEEQKQMPDVEQVEK